MVLVFTFAPDASARFARFDLDQAAPGIAYFGPGYLLSLARATSSADLDGEPADLEFTDFALRLSNDVVRRSLRSGVTFSVPLVLVSNYRRVRSEQAGVQREIFDHTAAGVGTGAAISAAGRRTRVDVRATPAIGLTTRSFGNSLGRFLAFEVDAQLTVARLRGRMGLSLGYGWGWQQWHVSGLEAFASSGSGKVNYSGTAHAVRLGVAW